MCYVGATWGAPRLAGASLCVGLAPHSHAGSSQARAPHGDQKSCVRIPSSWTSAAGAGRGERTGSAGAHCSRRARPRAGGCGEGARRPGPLTHLPPGPLSGAREWRAQGRREERGQRTVVSGGRAGGERRRRGSRSEAWPQLPLQSRLLLALGDPRPLPSQGPLPTPALRRLHPRAWLSLALRAPEGGRGRPAWYKRTPPGGRPLGVPEGDPVEDRSPGPGPRFESLHFPQRES